MAIPFEIIRHPNFVSIHNWFSGIGGDIDLNAYDIFKHQQGQPVKIKSIQGWFVGDNDFIIVKENDENGAEICRLGRAASSWVEVDDETGATAFRLSTVNGVAFADCPGFDFTPYQDGNHLVVFHDSAGKVAMAYIKAEAPAGETLDTTVITNGLFDSDISGWSLTPGVNTIEWDATGKLKVTKNAGTHAFASQQLTTIISALYKIQITIDSTSIYFRMLKGTTQNGYDLYLGSYVGSSTLTIYQTETNATPWLTIDDGNNILDITTYDNVSYQKVLVPSATGALLVSTFGGAVRNFASIDAGFNPNLVTSFEVKEYHAAKHMTDRCHFKKGGSLMNPFLDVSEAILSVGEKNRIIFEFI